jgi:hypothetical protein
MRTASWPHSGAARGVVFGDDDFECLYASRRGRPSHPPSVLAALLLGQMFYGVGSGGGAAVAVRFVVEGGAGAAVGASPHVRLMEIRARSVRSRMDGWFAPAAGWRRQVRRGHRTSPGGGLDRYGRQRGHPGHGEPDSLGYTPLRASVRRGRTGEGPDVSGFAGPLMVTTGRASQNPLRQRREPTRPGRRGIDLTGPVRGWCPGCRQLRQSESA